MILVAIGANLRDGAGTTPLVLCQQAADWLATLPGLTCHARSRWYDTESVPDPTQPRYVNGVIALQGSIAPATLLARLHAHEAAVGRVRTHPNAPRVIDLDVIDVNGIRRDAPDPVLPHPRCHQRAFVLLPLRDVAPGWLHPGLGRTVTELIDALPPQDTRLLDPLSP